MNDLKKIFDFCTEILEIELNVGGYDITLFEVLCFCVVGTLLLTLFYGMMD